MNNGLYTDEANLAFDELHDLIMEIGQIADKIAKGELPVEQVATEEDLPDAGSK